MSSAEISVSTTNPSTVVPNGWTPQIVERLGNIVNGDKVAGTQEVNSLGGIAGISSLLKTDIKSGLSSSEIATGTRKRIFGENRLPPPPSKSLLSLMIEALGETIIILLLIAAVVSWILGVFVKQEEDAWLEPVAIFVAVGIVVIAGSVNDFQKERQFRKLNEKQGEKEVSVIRDGQQVRISVFDVVVGDVVVLSVGDILSVDGVFINGNNLKLDESSATGEPDLILKSDTEPILMSGTKVKDGAGRFIVVSVGVNSFSGKIAISLRKDRGDTPLQRRLAVLANDIGKVGLAAATVTVLALIIKLGVTGGFQDEPGEIADKIIDYIITAITIVVLAVPEGLPLAVTISLAYAVLKMLQDNNLVRQLQASETMGSCTTVCSDKTGTLTQNRMTVVAGWIAESSFDQQSEIPTLKLSDTVKNLLIEGISVNTAAYETKKVINGVEVAEKQGSPTEWAQLTLVRELGADFMAIRHKYEEATVHYYPFSSALKRMATVIRREDGTVRVCSTGASEIILAECTHWVDAGGEVKEFDEAQRSLLQSVINKFASNALRTLMLAYRDIPEGESPDYEERQDVQLTMIGLVGIQDPLRPEVAQAVRDCQGAGIKVRMVTGDNATTAKNIAKNAGIWRYDDEVVLEGPVFREMSDEDLDKILPKLTILARSAPLDKQRLVERLKANHAVVAVTGDGTNDAPALQQADVGFAMNIAGTDVAKEAAAIILMDDNFASIVSAVSWGRNVFDAIRKFVQFQLTVNVAAVSLAFIGSLTDDEGESPLKPVQLLWLNLIMDTLGALALATGSPEPEMLTRPPVRPDDKLITRTMWINILGQSFFQLLVECYVLYFGFNLFGLEERSDEHLTLFFSVFVSLQVFNQINCRKVHGELNVFKGIRSNRIFVVILFAIIIIQALMVEFGAEFIGTVGLTIEEWIFVVIVGSLSLPVYLLLRFVVPDQDLNKERAFADKKAKELERTASQPSSPDIVATPRGPKRGWDRARDVRTEIAVINAFRRYRI